MTTLSTHVLDSARGLPAAAITVTLDGTQTLATDDDGRIAFDGDLAAGAHTLEYATGEWFAGHDRDTFFPSVPLTFEVEPDRAHLHVALLLGPFSYTAYRGS
ncbi:hydroxyisourate hydrolase [Aeromicrobium duanguangcaii]|uniref:hydroxyisourate hydrolase n=1 Tax=Aeromicrobium duanguangcaii TaxID=2968086 RepID=UPI002016ED2A|nr:hydroxyisourate hydrolase [Aeromicrobium duanguangcaii]MCL3836503.1 hydroxyisourate hydrolase [Aeromicrobium duanguangcaii]